MEVKKLKRRQKGKGKEKGQKERKNSRFQTKAYVKSMVDLFRKQ